MSKMMDKLKMHSPNFVDQNVKKLAELFPNCVSESFNDKGEVKLSIDFDLLKQELSEVVVDGQQERYQLNWPGKRESILAANSPIAKTLRPDIEGSINFSETKNIFIEGDNLDALKLINETYLGKVKLIYIDPPYNTGKDFVYSDDYSQNTEEYLEKSQQRDFEGGRLLANEETNGRIHSDWLSMIYPRIKLAYNLLTDDGAIFVSINHREVANLKRTMDEIFGDGNLLCMFSWRTDGNFDNGAKFKFCHEYVLAYGKNEKSFPFPPVVDPNTPEDSKIFNSEIRNTIVKNGPKNPPSKITLPEGFPCAFDEGNLTKKDDSWPHVLNDVKITRALLDASLDIYSGWSSKELIETFIASGCKPILDAKGQKTWFELTKSGAVEVVKSRGVPSHVISSLTGLGGPQKAASEIEKIGVVFDDYPKPTALVKYFIEMIEGDDFVVMDFFSGSATTAHAVMEKNCEDGGTRRFILIQLPEELDPSKKAYQAGYRTISEISKDRITKTSEILREKEGSENFDFGFRMLSVDSTNMAEVFYSPDCISSEHARQIEAKS